MRAGRLDRLIDIQRKTSTQSDSGAPVDAWNNIVTRRPSSYRPLRGDERFAAPQVVADEQIEFRIRHSAEVASLTPLDRVVYPAMDDVSPDEPPANRIYNILSAPEIGRREGIQIIAVRRPDVT